MKTLIVVLFLSFVTVGCSPKINATRSEKVQAYSGSLLVSFTSAGAGINHPAHEKLKTWVLEYNSKNKVAITYTTTARGKEGERELCFAASAIPDFESVASQIKTLMKDEKLVNITDHTDCPK